MCLRKKYFFLLIFIALSSAAFGQAASTPFSTFGIGEPYGNALIQNQGMGGIGVSQPQYWAVNNQNPALLVFNHYTSFQAGALIESRTIKSDSISQKGVNGNLSYLAAAFPVKQGKWTTSVGLMPYTNVNYKISYQDYVHENSPGNPIIDTASVLERGDGGLSQFYWANGIRISQDFSVGVKATYLFGSVNTDYSNALAVVNQPSTFIIGIKEQTYVKDFLFTVGASYSKDSLLNDDYRFSAGFVYNFATDLKASRTTIFQRRLSSGEPITVDTLYQKNGSIFIPPSFTFGISFSKGVRWAVGMEASYQDWSRFKSVNKEDEGLKGSQKISIGGEFTPDQFSVNYLKRISYRMGFSYEKNPIAVNNNQLKDIGINFGFSLPTGPSSLDWGLRIGKRGDKAETILEETYYKIYFGITFNDKWFIKRKFD